MVRKMADIEYIKGVQGGYDYSIGRWRNKQGRFASRDEALGKTSPNEWGMSVKIDLAPTSRKLEAVHLMMGGLLDISGYKKPDEFWNAMIAAEQGDTADPMPSDILAMMKLSEYFCKVEGDVWQTIEVPLTVGLKELVIEGPDDGLEKDIRELYERLDMLDTLTQIWLCVAMYGQAFPLEVFDGQDTGGVIILNPKYMRVGKTISAGSFSLDLIPENAGQRQLWKKELALQEKKPLFYSAFAENMNEQLGTTGNVSVKPEACHPVRALAPAFHRYAIPPLARAFRTISTRQILEELIRATIEGFRNQLWMFILGDGDHRPNKDEIAAFTSTLSGAAGDRTGTLVWRGPLTAEILTPDRLDDNLGREMWRNLTQHIFRQLGISVRLISGESPLREARTAEEADIRIFLERLEFWRRRVIEWAMGFNRRWLERTGGNKHADNLPIVKFGRVFLEIEELIKNLVMPLSQAGLLSKRTSLETAGYNFQTELQRKKEEEKDLHLFMPTPTFAQTTVRPGTPEKESETGPKGRPPDVQNPKKLVEGSTMYPEYHDKVVSAYDEMLGAEDKDEAIPKFISALGLLNAEYMRQAALDGYWAAGGSREFNNEYVKRAIDWNNSHLDGFEQALLEASDEERAEMKRRAEMYPREGDRIAFMYGVFLAMREFGARGWRRVLHPELSLTGPCEACIADSRLVHPIDEAFFEPHPEGVCTAQSIYFYRMEQPMEMPIVFPVPRRRSDTRIIRRQR